MLKRKLSLSLIAASALLTANSASASDTQDFYDSSELIRSSFLSAYGPGSMLGAGYPEASTIVVGFENSSIDASVAFQVERIEVEFQGSSYPLDIQVESLDNQNVLAPQVLDLFGNKQFILRFDGNGSNYPSPDDIYKINIYYTDGSVDTIELTYSEFINEHYVGGPIGQTMLDEFHRSVTHTKTNDQHGNVLHNFRFTDTYSLSEASKIYLPEEVQTLNHSNERVYMNLLARKSGHFDEASIDLNNPQDIQVTIDDKPVTDHTAYVSNNSKIEVSYVVNNIDLSDSFDSVSFHDGMAAATFDSATGFRLYATAFGVINDSAISSMHNIPATIAPNVIFDCTEDVSEGYLCLGKGSELPEEAQEDFFLTVE